MGVPPTPYKKAVILTLPTSSGAQSLTQLEAHPEPGPRRGNFINLLLP